MTKFAVSCHTERSDSSAPSFGGDISPIEARRSDPANAVQDPSPCETQLTTTSPAVA